MREKLEVSNIDEKSLSIIAKEIVDRYKESNKKELVIINIGTDKAIFDSVGCLNGTFLKEYNSTINVYGDLDNPIHALNIHDKIDKIAEKHNDAFIIGVDSCIGRSEDVNSVLFRDIPIKAGKGAGKELPHIGDLSLVGIVSSADGVFDALYNTVRLSLVYSLAKIITYIILKVEEILNGTCINKPKLINY